MTQPLQPREVRDVGALKALAHPLRQRILRQLDAHGPATSTTLARAFGENSGIMSYHLRLLARHDFVEEIPERAHGRERWWQIRPEPTWISHDQLSPAGRTAAEELKRLRYAEELEQFARFQAERERMGTWGSAFKSGQVQLTLTRQELDEFFEEYRQLVKRYQREPEEFPLDAHPMLVRFFAYPLLPPESPLDAGAEEPPDQDC